jgi:hypothetical protein
LEKIETQVTNELKNKATVVANDLKQMMDIYEKNKEKFAPIGANSGIYNKATGEMKMPAPPKERKEKRLPEQVAKDVESSVASFFKPLVQQSPGEKIPAEDVRGLIQDRDQQGLYDELRNGAYNALEINPTISAHQAVQKVLKDKGWWLEADTPNPNSGSKNGDMKVWRTPKGSTVQATGQASQKQAEKPPMTGAAKAPNGKWYVQKSGKWFEVVGG